MCCHVEHRNCSHPDGNGSVCLIIEVREMVMLSLTYLLPLDGWKDRRVSSLASLSLAAYRLFVRYDYLGAWCDRCGIMSMSCGLCCMHAGVGWLRTFGNSFMMYYAVHTNLRRWNFRFLCEVLYGVVCKVIGWYLLFTESIKIVEDRIVVVWGVLELRRSLCTVFFSTGIDSHKLTVTEFIHSLSIILISVCYRATSLDLISIPK